MKLILANNQSQKFQDFYQGIKTDYAVDFDYTSYDSLLFTFDVDDSQPIRVVSTSTGTPLAQYDGIYINGYLNTYELAASVAICADALGIPYVNHELSNPASLSKLSMYAKLTAAGVRLPRTVAGAAKALLTGVEFEFPAVLKRADADRGIDNFMVHDYNEVQAILSMHNPLSIWVLQKFIPNDGFYLVSFYHEEPKFCIFRSLEARSDGDATKAHMFKPKGGSNASLIDIGEVAPAVMEVSSKALLAMNRQIGSVDSLVGSDGVAYVLEVNYNPQLVTIETFKTVRIDAFVAALKKDWKNGSI